MSKIICNSQGPFNPNGGGITTGFAKAMYPICEELANNHRVTHVCHDYQGLGFNYHNYRVERGNRDFNKTAYEMKLHVESENPDFVIALNEPWGVSAYNDIKFGDTKWIYYVPIDGYPCDNAVKAMRNKPDLFVPISNFGKKVLNDAEISTPDPIPHAFDPEHYYRMKKTAREKVRSEYEFDDKFIIGFVGRQQERKNIMAMLVAFSEFAKKTEDTYLFLNMQIDQYADFDAISLAKYLGISDRVMLMNQPQGSKISETQLGELYNCFDLYLSTSCSEGFNMPVMEAQACGVPSIVPKYSAHMELVAGHGGLIPIESYKPMQNGITWGYCDINGTVELLNKLYDSPALRRKCADKATKYMENYTYKNVMPLWSNLIENFEDIQESVFSEQPIRRMTI